MKELTGQVRELIRQQKAEWPLLQKNYAGLSHVTSRSFSFGHFQIIVQFNPERIRSSAAQTDEASIRNRACFLCESNRPPEQKGIPVEGRNGQYTVLVNPYPIFPEHLTIPLNEHVPQLISPYFGDMLRLSSQLPEFTVFYNGPRCGASAPDHFHFQACTAKLMPLENEIGKIRELYGVLLFKNGNMTIHAVGKEYLRKFIFLSSSSEKELESRFRQILNILEERGQEGEPMVNIICFFREEKWNMIIFPRDEQRPWQFYEEGSRQIIISPASVEFGGLTVLPRKEDFEKITNADLADIYSQVTVNDTDFELICNKIKALS